MKPLERTLYLLAFLQPLALSGCITWGPKLNEFEPAKTPNGLSTEVEVKLPFGSGPSRSLQGELVAVDDRGIFILYRPEMTGQERVAQVAYESINRATFEKVTYLNITSPKRPAGDKREQLRLMSRYPQGVNSPGFQKLLASLDQTEIETIP